MVQNAFGSLSSVSRANARRATTLVDLVLADRLGAAPRPGLRASSAPSGNRARLIAPFGPVV